LVNQLLSISHLFLSFSSQDHFKMSLGRWEPMWIFLSLPRVLVGHFVPTADPSIIAEELDIIEAIGKSRMKNLE